MIKAVVFDLDDTLYPEYDYVKSGFRAVATELKRVCGVSDAYGELLRLFDESREKVFDRYLVECGAAGLTAERMVEIYRNHTPDIALPDDVKQTLSSLRSKGCKLGIITDGDPTRQRVKISALGIADKFDKIIVTDELGGKEFRKPNPKAFELMCDAFGIIPEQMLYVGDNPQKDFAVKKYLSINTVEFHRNGNIYSDCEYLQGIKPDCVINDVKEIERIINDEKLDKKSLQMNAEEFRDVVHEKLFELLKFADMICRNEGIAYSLCGGTLLGAIRHNGFIPWDDDVDVVMTRSESDRFLRVAEKYIANSNFALYKRGRVDGITFKSGMEFKGLQLDSLGCDVFVFDNVPDDDKLYRKQIFALKKLQGMMKKGKIDWKKYSFKGKLLVAGTKFLGAFHSEKSILSKYSKISQKYNDQPTKRKFISNDVFATFDIAYDNELLEGIVSHKFESEDFPIFKNYDKILTLLYGDYMTPPPPEERKFVHANLS